MTDRELLKEARDLIIMCTLLDKSGQCEAMVDKIDKQLSIADVSVSLVDNKFIKWLAKEAPELCESLYGCMYEYETNER